MKSIPLLILASSPSTEFEARKRAAPGLMSSKKGAPVARKKEGRGRDLNARRRRFVPPAPPPLRVAWYHSKLLWWDGGREGGERRGRCDGCPGGREERRKYGLGRRRRRRRRRRRSHILMLIHTHGWVGTLEGPPPPLSLSTGRARSHGSWVWGGAFSPAPFDPCVRVRVSECELPVSPFFPLFLVAARGIILHRRRRHRRSMRGEEE